MSIIDTLTLTQKLRATEQDETQRLRTKMADALERQIEGAKFEAEGKGVYRPKINLTVTDPETGEAKEELVAQRFVRWWWRDEKGGLFLNLRYGNKPIEIRPKKTAISVESPEALPELLIGIREAVLQGEFDQQLAKAAEARRAQFAAKKPAKVASA